MADDLHIERMKLELAELRDRKSKLATFTFNVVFMELDIQMQRLMKIQLHAMRAYHDALELRLDLLTK